MKGPESSLDRFQYNNNNKIKKNPKNGNQNLWNFRLKKKIRKSKKRNKIKIYW